MARELEGLKDFVNRVKLLGESVVGLVGVVGGGGEDMAHAGGVAEGENAARGRPRH